ncbi:protein N-lysine methyltransferase METTL21A isoform X4 [Gadus morhua]|uniref:protein N-lysine methyltransferase METTL21A isoform X4 n=1 Tax=Gadus morhua TaxID=8049 RepID=UPI0011B74753|nr:protein N-lysine methyltransferase METTL21A isoform X4 [Gadus morhua]
MALVPYTENALPALAKLHNSTATFHLAGREVLLNQDWRKSGVAAVVWDAVSYTRAVVLALYLELAPVELRGRPVIELGAGTGLVGIVAALLGARVTITDREPALELLSANVRANVPADLRPGSAEVSELSWGSGLERYPAGGFDLVLGADIVYLEDTFPALLATLDHLCSDTTAVLLACKIRYERDSRFLELLRERFSVEEVHFDRQRDIHVYRAVKRAPRAEL